MPVTLELLPGFADAVTDAPWTLRASLRLYADSAVTLVPGATGPAALTVPPGREGSRAFPLPAAPWPLGDGFFPLGILVVRAGDETWTREGGLPLPSPPMMR